MTNDEFEKIKSEFIVDQNSYKQDEIPHLVKKLLNYVRVGSEGKVYITDHHLLPDNRLKILLTARHLANQLQENILPYLSIDELSSFSGVDKDQVRARMSNLVKEKFAKREGRGLFSILPFQIQPFINSLNKESEDNE